MASVLDSRLVAFAQKVGAALNAKLSGTYPGDTSTFLRGDGAWITPAGGTGAWAAWTPTITPGSGTLNTVTIDTGATRYIQTGKTVTANFCFTIADPGTGTGNLFITFPAAPRAGASIDGTGIETAGTGKTLHIARGPGTGTGAAISYYDNAAGLIALNHVYQGSFTYEAA